MIWNRLPLQPHLQHCYALSAIHHYAASRARKEVYTVMDDLRAFGVPVLILGRRALMRPDLFDIAARAQGMGFYIGLSRIGTLIDEPMADRVAAAGFDDAGISLDGLKPTHDKFRRADGAFDRSPAAVRFRARGREGGPALHHDVHERALTRPHCWR